MVDTTPYSVIRAANPVNCCPTDGLQFIPPGHSLGSQPTGQPLHSQPKLAQVLHPRSGFRRLPPLFQALFFPPDFPGPRLLPGSSLPSRIQHSGRVSHHSFPLIPAHPHPLSPPFPLGSSVRSILLGAFHRPICPFQHQSCCDSTSFPPLQQLGIHSCWNFLTVTTISTYTTQRHLILCLLLVR